MVGRPLLLQLLLWAASGVTRASALVLDVTSGEEFVQAIKLFGQQGGQQTIALDGTSVPISLANATWDVEEQGVGFQSGSVAIRASIPGTKVILDTAMRSGLTPVLSRVEVTWQDIIFINKCSQKIPVHPEDGLFAYHSDSMFLMPRSWSVLSILRRSSIVYITRQELLGLIHVRVLEATSFPRLRDGWIRAMGPGSPDSAIVKAMDYHSVTFDSLTFSGIANRDVVYRSTSNKDDPLGLKLPELGGGLMSHRLCANDGSNDGPLLDPAEVLESDYSFFPTWLVSSTLQLHSSLVDVSERGLSVIKIRGERPPQIVLILQDVSMVSQEEAMPTGVLFRSDVLIHGPLHAGSATLDLANLSGAMRLTTNARLFIEGLVLTGLVSTAISTESSFNTSLHLAAFFRPKREMVHLSNVTLHVSKQDFIALLSAAHRSSRWQSGADSTAYIIRRISVFKPTLYDRTSLHLSEYIGWDVEGMSLIFKPLTPLLSSDQLLDQGTFGSDKDKVAIGVGVGVGAGAGLLLISAIWAVVAALRRHRRSRDVGGKDVEQGLGEHPLREAKSHGSSNCLEAGRDINSCESQDKVEADFIKFGSVEDVILMDGKMPIQKIAADQVEVTMYALLDPHALVRQQAATLVKPDKDGMLKLECVLGKGAWGTVYKGTWKGLTVAVKTVLFSEHTSSANKLPEKARAIMEAAISTSISHPNVVSTYYYDILPVFHGHRDGKGLQVAKSMDAAQDWKLFLVLEYCDCTLGYALQSDFLHMGSQPRWDRILKLLLDIAQGTLYLHNLHIIHGDLKPDNVLMKCDSDTAVGIVAKITDFGLAISLGPTATHASNFRSGTPFYCAPEVGTQGRTTKASDVFSYGIIMCEVCSKTSPWKRQCGEIVLNPEFPQFASGTPIVYRELAWRCLELDILKRPKFEEIVASLQNMLNDYKETLVQIIPDVGE